MPLAQHIAYENIGQPPTRKQQVERFNRTVQAKAVKDDQEWDLHLPQTLFAYRTSTGFTHFLLTFGRSPKLPIDRWIGQGDLEGGSFQNYLDMIQKVHKCLVASYSQVRRLAAAH